MERAFSEGRGPKINPLLPHVHEFHALFISCSTETERMGNEKFRREACPLLLLEMAGFCSELRVCVFRMLHMNGFFLWMTFHPALGVSRFHRPSEWRIFILLAV